jgi:hypothetical protein
VARSPEAMAAAAAVREQMVAATAAERVRKGVSIETMSDGSTTFRFSDTAGSGRESGRGVNENKHATDVEYHPPPMRVCISIHPRPKVSRAPISVRVLVLNDPPVRVRCGGG